MGIKGKLEKVKNFVCDHSTAIVIGLGGAAVFVCGAIVGNSISNSNHLDQLKLTARTGISVGGFAGMTTVAQLIGDKIPEADKIIIDYCSENNVDFNQLFQENQIIIDATKQFGKISLP